MTTDHRYFRRYRKESKINLNFRKKPVKAKMVDYSLNGIGTLFYGAQEIKKGDILGMQIAPLAVNSVGKVMWIERDNACHRVGLKTLSPLKGHLRDFPLSDTFIGLKKGRVTGVLRFTDGMVSKDVFYRDGDMIFAASNQREERLGDYLLNQGKITAKQYAQAAIEMKRTGQRFGRALVGLGFLQPRTVLEAVWSQVEEIIQGLFNFNGTFIFDEILPTEELITLNLSTANLIYYGQKSMKGLPVLKDEMLSAESVLYFSSDPASLFQDLRLDEAGMKIISAIDHKSTVSNIIAETGLDIAEVSRTVHALLNTRVITTVQQEAIHENEIKDVFSKDTEPDIKDVIEDMHRKYKRLGYYGVLGVKRTASFPEIRKAYYNAARKFHPDIHFRLKYYQLKEKTSDIFSYINEAYTALSNPQRRKQYDGAKTDINIKPVSNPVMAKVIFKEGKAFFEKKKYAQARERFAEAVSHDAKNAAYHYYYGMVCAKLDRNYEAKKAIERAIGIDPHNSFYLSELANLCLKTGNQLKAKSLLAKASRVSRRQTDL